MEIRCEKCSHIGPAASVDAGADGVMLTCENCGHQNLLSTGPAEAAFEKSAEARNDDGAPSSPGRHGARDAASLWLRKDALSALVPTPGDGARCLKCVHLLGFDLALTPEPEQNCSRCGLNQAEAAHYGPGEAPWERPTPGKDAAFEQAELLWAAIGEVEPGSAAAEHKLQNFVGFVVDEDLLELGIRKLRAHLVAFPEDETAVAQLGELATSMQSRVIVATARARADAQQFEQEVDRYRSRFITVAIILLAVMLVLFIVIYLGK
ncbi:hypothetical protein [Bradymonas sediminis]|uniref:Uncharacterized protein n=1 Tax=Bradymonas sediminis TaxID=1548548 RepID=A0A2Z4FN61_9DELT|nr:hypothetical protein [Bradymonas sediminis]AWV90118.1 hypothetical protein DN745_12560 [Bradymonas sediminis]TDP75913.1 hypothetical protein DFR33_103261 [Bradymonas sediminis]